MTASGKTAEMLEKSTVDPGSSFNLFVNNCSIEPIKRMFCFSKNKIVIFQIFRKQHYSSRIKGSVEVCEDQNNVKMLFDAELNCVNNTKLLVMQLENMCFSINRLQYIQRNYHYLQKLYWSPFSRSEATNKILIRMCQESQF
ncbi:unnamed protein product, partial (macronuclear) [Paramecium tetraurelia]